MPVLVSLRWLLVFLFGHVWALVVCVASRWRILVEDGFVVSPPFWRGYYGCLIARSRRVIDDYSPMTRKDKSFLDLFILDRDDVYFLDAFRWVPALRPSPAVVYRYWHAKQQEPVYGFLHSVYHCRTLHNDVKCRPTTVRWCHVKSSMFESPSTVLQSIISVRPTVIDKRLVSFLKAAPSFGQLVRQESVIPGAIANEMVDCVGLMCWLKDFSVTFVKTPVTREDFRTAYFTHPTNCEHTVLSRHDTTETNDQVTIGHAIQLLNIDRTWRGGLHLADDPVFHYAVKLFDNLYISKCGKLGGIFIGTLAETMNLYGMDVAAMRFLRFINDDSMSNRVLELISDVQS